MNWSLPVSDPANISLCIGRGVTLSEALTLQELIVKRNFQVVNPAGSWPSYFQLCFSLHPPTEARMERTTRPDVQVLK